MQSMNDSKDNRPLSTESYKGVRDFYPQDQRLHNYLFSQMRQTALSYGYEEIDASVLEPIELYKAKSGEEIVGEQTYRFRDRGDREVALRPEMTPSVARMVAAKQKELPLPIRWFSIPNLFRYEKPQRGRLREHWQLNADIYGDDSVYAEVEIITMAHSLLKRFGARDDDFVIKLNSRNLTSSLFDDVLELNDTTAHKLLKLFDKKAKLPPEVFDDKLSELLTDKQVEITQQYMAVGSVDKLVDAIPELADTAAVSRLKTLTHLLEKNGIGNAIFDPSLARGLDYYTGVVFEVFDTHPENSRSIFGGGRYDNLTALFGAEPIPAVGFGCGDVTLEDFLKVHELVPELTSGIDLNIIPVNDHHIPDCLTLAEELRDNGVNVRVGLSGKNIGTQIKNADGSDITYITVVGDDELESSTFAIKHLESGEEKEVSRGELAEFFSKK